MKVADKISVFPIGVIPKESKNGWVAENFVAAYIQIINSGFAIYKANGMTDNAGYKVYPTIEDLLEDFDVEENDMHRIDAVRV